MMVLGDVATDLVLYNSKSPFQSPNPATDTGKAAVSFEHLLPAFPCIPSLQIVFLPCLPSPIHSPRVLSNPFPFPLQFLPFPLSPLSLHSPSAFMAIHFPLHTSLLLSQGRPCSCQREISLTK